MHIIIRWGQNPAGRRGFERLRASVLLSLFFLGNACRHPCAFYLPGQLHPTCQTEIGPAWTDFKSLFIFCFSMLCVYKEACTHIGMSRRVEKMLQFAPCPPIRPQALLQSTAFFPLCARMGARHTLGEDIYRYNGLSRDKSPFTVCR